MNREWSGETHIPLARTTNGAGGRTRPADELLSRARRFAFQVHVPKDFGDKEIVWTLTSKGKTEKTYGTLKPDYVLDDTSIMSNIGTGGGLSTTPDMVGNKAPCLAFEGPKSRSAKVGERSPSQPSRPTMGNRIGKTCRRGSAATTRCRPQRTACACRSSSIAVQERR
jgi:hypothetical protein